MARPLIKENLLDKALEFVAPRMAVKRRQARMVLALSGSGGGYSGASKRRTALSNWQTSAGSAEADISPDLPHLRERSRDLVRNTPIATGAVELATTHVIGTGLAANPSPNFEYLGLTEEQASEWVKNVKREWALFANNKDVDIGRRMNFYQCQALAFRSRMESGDVFVLTPNIDRTQTVYRIPIL
jgi:capsid protein